MAVAEAEASGREGLKWRSEWWLVAGLMVLGTGLIFFRIDYMDLWLDEIGTWWTSSPATAGEVVGRALEVQGQSPLYYLMAWALLQVFDDHAVALRLVSAVSAVLCLPLVYLLGKRLCGGVRGGQLAMVYMMVQVVFLRYGQEGRPYMLAILLTLASMLFLLKAMEDGRKRWLVLYGVTAVGVFYAHYLFLWILPAQVCYLLHQRYYLPPHRRRWLVTGGAMALAILPTMPQFLALWGRRGDLYFTPELVMQGPILIVHYLVGGFTLVAVLLVAVMLRGSGSRQPDGCSLAARRQDGM